MKTDIIKIISLLLCIAAIASAVSCTNAGNKDPYIVFCDIGKADCSIIRYNDKTVVIDTGEEEDSQIILNTLKSNKVNTIDYLILSHFDKDHIGGTEAIFSEYTVKNVYQSNIPQNNKLYKKVQSILSNGNCKIYSDPDNDEMSFTINDMQFTLYYPQKVSYSKNSDNNASIIVSLSYKNNNVLFCGDAVEERIDEFCNDNKQSFELMKAPYHGNYIQNYEELIKSTKCKNMVITSSNKNPEDIKTLELFEKNGINSYLTKNGQIKVKLLRDKIEIKQ